MECLENKNNSAEAELFFCNLFNETKFSLDTRDFGRVWSFGAVDHLELNFVAFFQILEFDVHKLVGVEKEILFLTLAGDETESAVCQPFDCSLFHFWYDDYLIHIRYDAKNELDYTAIARSMIH